VAETLSIRRTFILGLGTTGKEVAEAVAEHLNWQFGSFEKASWVRLLVVETEQPNSPLGDRVLRAGISREEYAPYLNAPRTAGAEFDFYNWQDGQSLRAIDNPSAGAGNLRMLGRLCVFHSSTNSESATYDRLKRRSMAELSALKQLTPQLVADQLGRSDLKVDIHTDTVVYVVGTLCGGTCSGACADMGYLLREWYGDGIDCQAIFTIPHPQLQGGKAARYKKNAYYALKELNHYQLESTAWLQKLPGNDGPSRRTEKPYVITRVLMPGGPEGADVRRLNVMIGQYLAAASGPAGGAIAARDVDAKGNMETADSVGFMRPLFSTMGVGALEYPGEHILRATTTRLMGGALEAWCRAQITPERISEALKAFAGSGESDTSALLQRLSEAGATGVGVQELRNAVQLDASGKAPRVENVRQLLREFEERLAASEPAVGSGDNSSTPTLAGLMDGSVAGMANRVDADIQQFVERWLFDLDGGPAFVAAVLEERLRKLQGAGAWLQESLPEYMQDSRSLKSVLDEELAAAEEVQNSHNPFGKKDRLAAAWGRVASALEAYLKNELKTQTAGHLQRRDRLSQLADRHKNACAILIRRLDGMQAAFSQAAAGLNDAWKAMSADVPSVNGLVYFDAEPPAPRGTVTEEYYSLLRQRIWPGEVGAGWDDSRKEIAARREVLKPLEQLMQDIKLADGQSAFDPKPGRASAMESIPTDVLDAVQQRARAFFEPLRGQVHIADKMSVTDLDAAIQLSAPRLGVHGAQISPQLQGARAIRPQAQNLAFMDLSRSDTRTKQMIGKIESDVALARDGKITDSHDPFRMLIVQERHGFTFGQMEGVVSSHAYDLAALQSAEGAATDFHFWHTRRDVNWLDPLVPPRRVEETEEWWLQLVLLGRPADGIFEWNPADKGEIRREGWYQVAGSEFRVFYPQGVAGVTETEARVPLDFNSAVMTLLSPSLSLLRQCLNVYISQYRAEQKETRYVAALSEGAKNLNTLGVAGIGRKQADRILRRAFGRDPILADAYFVYETEASKNSSSLFAHIYRLKGQIMPDSSEEFGANAYYCPHCNFLLSDSVEPLRAAHFLCPRCGDRYWP
jgi:Tubulin like